MNTTLLLWGALFGCVGYGFFIYGKRQQAIVPLICGLVLMIFPYFTTNTIVLIISGILLVAIPFVIRR